MNGKRIDRRQGAVENEWFDVRVLPSPDVIPRDQELLSRVMRSATSRIEWQPDGRRVRFRGLAGVVSIAGGVVPVRPKFAADRDWLTALLRVAAVLGRSRARRAFSLVPGRLPAAYLASDFVDLVAWVFATDLMIALRDGPLMVYRRATQDRGALRGRLLIHQQVRRLPHQRHHFPCSFTEMSADNDHVRLLAWSAHELMRRSRLSTTRYALGQVIDALPPPRVSPALVDTLAPLPAGAQHYAVPMSIARELARVRSVLAPDETRVSVGGRQQVASFLVDMAAFFEGLVSWLYSDIARERRWVHAVQTKTPFAVRQGGGQGSTRRFLRPDDAVDTAGPDPVSVVSDSKYHGRVAGDDNDDADGRLRPAVFYQLTCSMLARNANCGLLVQPRIEALSPGVPDLEEWHVSSPLLAGDRRIVLVRLDLTLINEDVGLDLLRSKLAEGLDAALELAR